MEYDEKLLDYNPSQIVASLTPNRFSEYAHLEKKILIHKLPLHQQKHLLMKHFLINDENYIYEFDEETHLKRKELVNKAFGLSSAAMIFYVGSNYMFWKKIKPIEKMRLEFKFLYLVGLNMLPLVYFSYEAYKCYYDLDNFLFNKYLKCYNK